MILCLQLVRAGLQVGTRIPVPTVAPAAAFPVPVQWLLALQPWLLPGWVFLRVPLSKTLLHALPP